MPEESSSAVIELTVDEIEKALGYILKTAEACDKAYDDGKIHYFDDLPHIFNAATNLGKFVTIDFNLAGRQARNVDMEERRRLAQYVRDNFDISNEKVEEIIEEAIDLALQQVLIVQRTIAVVRKFRN